MSLIRKYARLLEWNDSYEIMQVISIMPDGYEIRNIRGLQDCIVISPQGICTDYFRIQHSKCMIVSHSHPSNDSNFSDDDLKFYVELRKVCGTLGIWLNDFLIKTECDLISIHQSEHFNSIDNAVKKWLGKEVW